VEVYFKKCGLLKEWYAWVTDDVIRSDALSSQRMFKEESVVQRLRESSFKAVMNETRTTAYNTHMFQ